MRKMTKEQNDKRDARREKFKAIAETIAAMGEADRSALAAKMLTLFTVEGHAISDKNRMMIAMQNPDATLIGGFRQWLNHGRCVRKGESGLMIWVPITIKAKAAADGAPIGEASGDTKFMPGTVFDVSQTVAIDAANVEANGETAAAE